MSRRDGMITVEIGGASESNHPHHPVQVITSHRSAIALTTREHRPLSFPPKPVPPPIPPYIHIRADIYEDARQQPNRSGYLHLTGYEVRGTGRPAVLGTPVPEGKLRRLVRVLRRDTARSFDWVRFSGRKCNALVGERGSLLDDTDHVTSELLRGVQALVGGFALAMPLAADFGEERLRRQEAAGAQLNKLLNLSRFAMAGMSFGQLQDWGWVHWELGPLWCDVETRNASEQNCGISGAGVACTAPESSAVIYTHTHAMSKFAQSGRPVRDKKVQSAMAAKTTWPPAWSSRRSTLAPAFKNSMPSGGS